MFSFLISKAILFYAYISWLSNVAQFVIFKLHYLNTLFLWKVHKLYLAYGHDVFSPSFYFFGGKPGVNIQSHETTGIKIPHTSRDSKIHGPN